MPPLAFLVLGMCPFDNALRFRDVACSHVCAEGRCRFTQCVAPSCPGGLCEFVRCAFATCAGGACVSAGSRNTDCSGGGCRSRALIVETPNREEPRRTPPPSPAPYTASTVAAPLLKRPISAHTPQPNTTTSMRERLDGVGCAERVNCCSSQESLLQSARSRRVAVTASKISSSASPAKSP